MLYYGVHSAPSQQYWAPPKSWHWASIPARVIHRVVVLLSSSTTSPRPVPGGIPQLPNSLPNRLWLPNQLIVYLLDWLLDSLTDWLIIQPICPIAVLNLFGFWPPDAAPAPVGYPLSPITLYPPHTWLRTCCGFQLPFDRTSLLLLLLLLSLMLTKTETKIRDAGGHNN